MLCQKQFTMWYARCELSKTVFLDLKLVFMFVVVVVVVVVVVIVIVFVSLSLLQFLL